MEISRIGMGLMLILFGRKLFWLAIGIAGFLFGLEITRLFFVTQPQWVQLVVALGMGALGALLAMLAQRLAFTLAGFFTGVFLALRIGASLAWPEPGWLLIIGGGIIGALLATLFMDLAITILSCLVGAAAIVGELPLDPALKLIAFATLAGAGILLQEKIGPSGKKVPRV